MPISPSHTKDSSDKHAQKTLPILALIDFSIQRGEFVLCHNVNLNLVAGQVCHLIGANGTGKTTLLMQLAGLLPTEKNSLCYQGSQGLPLQPIYVSHQLGIHPSLSVSQNLTFLLNLYGVSPSVQDIDKALSWVGLQGYETLSSNELSAGQTRRVTLARLALMGVEHTPLWLLDEPFTALDVAMVARMQQRIQDFADMGGAVLMTSHQPVEIATKQLNLSDFTAQLSYDNDGQNSHEHIKDIDKDKVGQI